MDHKHTGKSDSRLWYVLFADARGHQLYESELEAAVPSGAEVVRDDDGGCPFIFIPDRSAALLARENLRRTHAGCKVRVYEQPRDAEWPEDDEFTLDAEGVFVLVGGAP